MKKLLFVFLFLAAVPSFAQIQSATLKASGLTCSMCSKAIYKSLLKVPSVQSVDVDIETSDYAISFKPGAPVVLDEVAKAVTNAGFSVASMKVTALFHNNEVGNDTHLSFQGNTYHFLNVPAQTLSGAKTFTVVDKNFLPAAERKKYGKFTAMKCFETGKMSPCCSDGNVAASTGRVYHVTL